MAYGLLITDKSEHVFSSTRHLTGPILFATRHKATCVIFLRFVLLLRAKKQVLRSAAGSARAKVTRCHKRKWVCLICHVPVFLLPGFCTSPI